MTSRSKVVLAAIAVVLVGVAVVLAAVRGRDGGMEVRTEEVARRDLVQLVTASGNIRARRAVELSSDISAKVAEMMVEEGEDVTEGQVLLRLDPAQYRAGVSRARAALSQAEAQEAQQEANLIQARRNLDRLLALRGRDSLLVSPQQIDDARTAVEVAEASLGAARFGVSQARASLDEAEDLLSRTVIRAPMDGKVTRLNVEEGETVIIGTMNNPGSLILTISDLSVVEVVVQVDETDVPGIQLGDSAVVRIDAFGDRTFTGRVTEIGNSAIRPPSSQQTSGQQAAIDFEVVITLDSTDVPLRPDLSATADVVTETREDALAVPIIALTVREGEEGGPGREGTAAGDREGVFLVRNGEVLFTPVTVGITGQEHFEVLSGVEAGDTIVAGPYQTIRQLDDGDPVTPAEADGGSGDEDVGT
jgi:HlyD family secretion protein